MKSMLVCACAATTAIAATSPAALGQVLWSDDFDSYPPGPLGQGVGGWEPWDLDPGALGYTITADQARSAPQSLMTTASNDATHEYSGITAGAYSGIFEFTAWSYVGSSMTDSQYFTLLHTNDNHAFIHEWALYLQLDGATGLVIDDRGNSTALIVDEWAEIRVLIDLESDEMTIDYHDTLVATRSWSGGVIPHTQLEAVDLWGDYSMSPVYWDDFSLEVVPNIPCPEDINGDGVVNISDLLAVLAAWGPCPGCPEDITGDGVVNVTDLLAVLAAWGPCP